MRMEGGLISLSEENNSMKCVRPSTTTLPLYHDLPSEDYLTSSQNTFAIAFTSISPRLGLNLPNPAPEVEMSLNQMQIDLMHVKEVNESTESYASEPKKKKYAKEAWPGKKPIPTLLV